MQHDQESVPYKISTHHTSQRNTNQGKYECQKDCKQSNANSHNYYSLNKSKHMLNKIKVHLNMIIKDDHY